MPFLLTLLTLVHASSDSACEARLAVDVRALEVFHQAPQPLQALDRVAYLLRSLLVGVFAREWWKGMKIASIA